jgi:thioredoxin 1
MNGTFRVISAVSALAVIGIINYGFAGAATTKKAAVADSARTSPAQKAIKNPEMTILFFMNPNGRPCQMQLAILDEMKAKLDQLATVTYIKTTVDSDYEKFMQHGIRGLPSLIFLDKTGNEIKRLTGIQNESTILQALQKK